MRRRLRLWLAGASALFLGGCAAGIAANVVGLAVQSARGEPVSNEHAKPAARDACSERASPYGTVHIIDVEQRSTSKIIVWGTVDDGMERRSFECAYTSKITSFKVRAISK